MDRFGRKRDFRAGTDVLMQQRAEIHPVKLVAAEDDIIIKWPLQEIAHVLPDCVGRALIPLRVFRRLLRGQDIDKAAREIVELVTRLDVAMQRHAVELGQHVDRPQSRVQAIADRNIDKAIFSPKGTAGLERSLVRGNNRVPAPPPMTIARVRCVVPGGSGRRVAADQ